MFYHVLHATLRSPRKPRRCERRLESSKAGAKPYASSRITTLTQTLVRVRKRVTQPLDRGMARLAHSFASTLRNGICQQISRSAVIKTLPAHTKSVFNSDCNLRINFRRIAVIYRSELFRSRGGNLLLSFDDEHEEGINAAGVSSIVVEARDRA